MPVALISRTRRFLTDAFGTPLAALWTLMALAIGVPMAWMALNWLLIGAVWPWQPVEICGRKTGICWPFIVEKLQFILFGTYPHDQIWRPATASAMLCALTVQTGLQMTGRGLRLSVRQAVLIWVVALIVTFVLMAGGVGGLPPVDSVRWNGLPVLLILSVVAIALAFPLGVLLALAREQTGYRVLSRFATSYIEIARGVPMLTFLFVGVFVLPMMLPPGTRISPVGATLVALILFHAAYFAEDVRGGLRALPTGQAEAARALGLAYPALMIRVLLPQAIRSALPSIVNSTIGAYKDTSLVVVLGIHDLTATARMASSDPGWREYTLEAYFIVGLWFFVSCAFLSATGRALPRHRSGRVAA
ncbi:amino acid ABC transporter permease [Phyllobacterium phragmitis]|uniref:Amino acid ABC transporter permease n=1 Tax=Phyllobacterium phragmitis TaxID=2670329 RepID=A0A2S9IJS7_9HYPH|nr:amino acid ABC transporter permease [Phyllobacterium phragmitis]PRD40769.1 amino acid ABC transporter permease [Phyllobacterium phragmitis]